MRNFIVIFIFIFFVNNQSYSQELKKTYFGGGCFWCMEESFDKVEGVTNVVSGYSGGTKPNPTYKDCLLYTSPSPRDATLSRMPSSA